MVRVIELKKTEQGGKTIEKFVQEFMRAARGSRYKEKLLVEKFKREINRIIYQKLIELEWQSALIKQ